MTEIKNIQVSKDITQEIEDMCVEDDFCPDDGFDVIEEPEQVESFDIEKIKNEISESNKDNFKSIIIPKIKKLIIPKLDQPLLVDALKKQYKALYDVNMPTPDARSIVVGNDTKQNKKDDVPTWCKNWSWVTGQSMFINMSTREMHTKDSFNISCGKYVPFGDNNTKPSAVKYVADHGFVRSVANLAYIPSLKSVIFDMEGKKYINTFNPETIPSPDDNYTTDGLEAIERVKRHIRMLCTTEENSEIFTQWLAHNIQHKGEKILWAPLFQSFEGIGKSFFGNLLEACLGQKNVGTVSSEQVNSGNNGWATGRCVNILQELRVQGKNRYEVANALKPLITDRTIEICDKWVRSYNTRNVTNYICFTNYKDALPLTENDRRWWVIFVPLKNKEDLKRYLGDDFNGYFERLFGDIEKLSGQIHKWLNEYKISAQFKAMKTAPITKDKQSLILSERMSQDGLIEAEELIKEQGQFWTENIISTVHFFKKLSDDFDVFLKKHQKTMILRAMGFTPHSQALRINGEVCRFWTKEEMTNEEIRAMFDDGFL